MNQTEWIEFLKEFEAIVTFTKKDGTKRVMHCTLMPKHLPTKEKITESTRKRSTETVSVWDLDANDWRSFVVANVVSHVIAS